MKLTDKEARHIMIDIETMGLLSDSVILSIGAVYFDRKIGLKADFCFNKDNIKDTFYTNGISMNDQISMGRKIYPDTVRWWIKQNKEAQQCMMTDVYGSFKTKVLNFYAWMLKNGSGDCYVWCKRLIDRYILEDIFFKFGIEPPWNYRKIIDLGSLLELIPCDVVKCGVLHNALDDAKYQAEQAATIMAIYDEMQSICITHALRAGNVETVDNGDVLSMETYVDFNK